MNNWNNIKDYRDIRIVEGGTAKPFDELSNENKIEIIKRGVAPDK